MCYYMGNFIICKLKISMERGYKINKTTYNYINNKNMYCQKNNRIKFKKIMMGRKRLLLILSGYFG